MDDEKLVEAMREYECLWKVGSKSYKDIRAKENAWKEVTSNVSTSCVLTCMNAKRDWNNYMREREIHNYNEPMKKYLHVHRLHVYTS